MVAAQNVRLPAFPFSAVGHRCYQEDAVQVSTALIGAALVRWRFSPQPKTRLSLQLERCHHGCGNTSALLEWPRRYQLVDLGNHFQRSRNRLQCVLVM